VEIPDVHPKRLLVIGLDCATPELLFDRPDWKLPAMRGLMTRGTYGTLRTVTPAITIPAWACMMTGKDPGELGIYGFRNRTDHSYTGLRLATSLSVKERALWDVLGAAGRQIVTVGVPPAYPPKPVNGTTVGCFLTPGPQSAYTYPASAKDEIEDLLHADYLVDCPNFRTEDKDGLLRQLYDMTERRFAVIEDWLVRKPWDFFMFVEIGSDRLHHGFWKFFDPLHRGHVPGNKYQNVIRQYYEDLDVMLARALERVDQSATHIFVVSDHGAKRMDGGICINEWLVREGYLTLNSTPTAPTPFAKLDVDWSRTSVWGEGGYYARVFFNIAGREPQGVVPPDQVERLSKEIARKIAAIPDDLGRPLQNEVFRPHEIYRTVRGIAPDLMVYFGDLHWRSVGSVGYGGALHTFENDIGPDDANHARHGIYIEALADRAGLGRSDDVDILSMYERFMGVSGLPLAV
jgi:predicted AlkP superfamily phosphohydrolase/phosphomutase